MCCDAHPDDCLPDECGNFNCLGAFDYFLSLVEILDTNGDGHINLGDDISDA
jgi:hypothetical protein